MSTVWEQLVGQEAVAGELRAAARSAAGIVAGTSRGPTTMTHAWLFTGPPGSGRSTAARAFAAALQCRAPGEPGCGECSACHTAIGGTHADVHRVVPEGLTISVSEMRSLVQLAARRPVTGRWQVVIIEDADRLTEGAANALLKSVEEPAERTVFLLCAPSDHPEDVPVTIRSRCRVSRLGTPRPDAVADVLVRRDGIDPERARWAGSVCGGHVGRARRLATDDAARERRDSVLRIPVSLRRMSDLFVCADDLVRTAESEAAGVSGERDDVEKEELRIAMGADGTGKGTAAANRSANAAVKQLETRQKRRATRTQRDSLDLALVDLAGFYRDVLAVLVGAGDARRNHPDHSGDVATVAAASTPELTLRRLESVLACRDALTRNVKPRIAVEAMLTTLRES